MESLNFNDIPGAEEKVEDFLDNLMNPNQDVFARTQRTFLKFKKGVACQNLNRNFIGIEIDPDYFKLAKERIHKENKNADVPNNL